MLQLPPVEVRHLLLQQLPLPVHAAPLGRLHVRSLQQTLGAVQVTQVPPPVPQAVAVLPAWQVPLWQHSVDEQQEEVPHALVPAGHTHVPFTHTSEPGHVTGSVPQTLLTQVAR